MRMFELLIGLLVLCVLGSFVAMLVKVGPDWGDAFKGYLPSSGIISNGAIYIAVGIIGATVMPHAFYIGSKMACMRRLKPEDYGEEPDPEEYDSDDHYSDEGEDEDDKDALKKKGDDATASARAGRSRIRSTESSRRRDSAPPPDARPYIPFLHLPQPMRMPNVGFDLGKLSRVRTESTERAAPGQRREETGGWKSYFTSSLTNKKRTATKRPGTPELGQELERVQSRTSGLRSAPIDDIVDLSERPDLRDADAAGGGGGAATLAAKKPTPRRGRRRSSLACVRAHLTHACLDVAGSLLGFALVVNSAILILGAAVFYYGDGQSSSRTGVR